LLFSREYIWLRYELVQDAAVTAVPVDDAVVESDACA
jgi:hypothetical protein